MKKLYKMIIPLVFVLCGFLAAVDAKADTTYKYKSLPLSENKLTTQKSNDYSYSKGNYVATVYRYKLVIPADGYLKVWLGKKGTGDVTYGSFLIFRTLKSEREWNLGHRSVYSGLIYIPISKGTYYCSWNCDNNQMKYQFIKVKQKKNYTLTKAAQLKKGKKEVVCQTPMYNYSRWYKIKLTKEQKITVKTNLTFPIIIFDQWHDEVSSFTSSVGNYNTTVQTHEVQAPGTYYICVNRKRTQFLNDMVQVGEFVWN